MSDYVSPDTLLEIKKMSGKSMLSICLNFGMDIPGYTVSVSKRDLLADINAQLGTRYHVNHLNNWLAGRVSTPGRVQKVLMLKILQYLFGDDLGGCLNRILNS